MDFSESTLIYLKKCGVDFHFQKYPKNPRAFHLKSTKIFCVENLEKPRGF